MENSLQMRLILVSLDSVASADDDNDSSGSGLRSVIFYGKNIDRKKQKNKILVYFKKILFHTCAYKGCFFSRIFDK